VQRGACAALFAQHADALKTALPRLLRTNHPARGDAAVLIDFLAAQPLSIGQVKRRLVALRRTQATDGHPVRAHSGPGAHTAASQQDAAASSGDAHRAQPIETPALAPEGTSDDARGQISAVRKAACLQLSLECSEAWGADLPQLRGKKTEKTTKLIDFLAEQSLSRQQVARQWANWKGGLDRPVLGTSTSHRAAQMRERAACALDGRKAKTRRAVQALRAGADGMCTLFGRLRTDADRILACDTLQGVLAEEVDLLIDLVAEHTVTRATPTAQ
jgi:hypothetical protein